MTPPPSTNAVFHALSHDTRRQVVARLGRGPASVGDLAVPFGLALPTFMQHLRVLEDAGLVASEKQGRVRTYHLTPAPLAEAEHWLSAQRALWERRLDQLDDFLQTPEEK